MLLFRTVTSHEHVTDQRKTLTVVPGSSQDVKNTTQHISGQGHICLRSRSHMWKGHHVKCYLLNAMCIKVTRLESPYFKDKCFKVIGQGHSFTTHMKLVPHMLEIFVQFTWLMSHYGLRYDMGQGPVSDVMAVIGRSLRSNIAICQKVRITQWPGSKCQCHRSVGK